jgi:ribonuclease HII
MMLLRHLDAQRFEAGVDEVGRGPLAGPVVAAAVILPPDFENPLIQDSKSLSPEQRADAAAIIQSLALTYAIAEVDVATIDQINILQAAFRAMNQAISQLTPQPEHLLIDGNRFATTLTIPYTCIIKGDSQYQSIAAASILAKVHRDAIMTQLHEQFPMYGWLNNKGYPTPAHRKAIAAYGPCPWHRKSFQLLPRELSQT